MTNAAAFDVALFGEAMLLLVADRPGPIEHATAFHKRTAGAETNVAIGLSRLGLRVGWASRLGTDSMGRALLATMQGEGIDCSHVISDAAQRTGFQFKGRVTDGSDPPVEYHRKGSAASHMGPADVDEHRRLIRLALCGDDAVELPRRLRRQTLRFQLRDDAALVLLVDLVERAQHVGRALRRNVEVPEDAFQHLAIADTDAEGADRHLLEDGVDHARDLRLGQVRQRLAPDDVDVALVELAEAAALHLRVLAAPDPLNLITPEGKGELALAHRHVASERHREIEAQRALRRRLVVLVGGEARERVDLLLGAALGGEHLDPLGRRRLDRQEAEALEVAADELDERIELQLLGRQKLLIEALQEGGPNLAHARFYFAPA